MKPLSSMFKLIGERPTIAIQFVLGVASIVYGIFVLTLYVPNADYPALIAFFLLSSVRLISGLFAIIPGLFAVFASCGLGFGKYRKNRVSQIGSYGLFLAYMYNVVVRFLTGTGFIWTWVFPLALAFIAGILVLSARWQDDDEE